MIFTDEMIAEDEKRWHARDVVTELGYCGEYMRDRKDMTNDDIRFYAYIMRKACRMLKEQEAKPVKVTKNAYNYEFYHCPNCGRGLELTYYKRPAYCDKCGQELKWDE